MLCTKCKDSSTARGIKDIKCRICEKDRIANVQYSDVCTDCSDLMGMCQRCGDACHNLKEDDYMKIKTKLRSAADASRATVQASQRLHNSRMERVTETINTAISEGKYSVAIDDLDKDSIVKLRELGYTVGKCTQYNEFYCLISW